MATQSIIIGGTARFTVIARELVRLEQSPSGTFTGEPTLFARERAVSACPCELRNDGTELVIDTGALRLRYRGAGAAFTADNLEIMVADGGTVWRPGLADPDNLGGPLATMDGVQGPVPLPDGLLSRQGWHLVDDSGGHLLRDGWIVQRPLAASTTDWYFFGYGRDYKAALRALTVIGGAAPLPRRHVFGSWYCRWWSYTSDDYRSIVEEYRQHDFPLDILVMDMDWHRKDGRTGFGWAGMRGWTGWSWNRDLLPDAEALLAELRRDRLAVTLNVHPHDGIRSTDDTFPEFMRDLGRTPEDADPPFQAGNRDYMCAYFRHGHAPHEQAGVDFWWVDWQQDSLMPYAYPVPYLQHLPWLNYLYFEHTAAGGRRGLSFSRWAGWGDHRHPIHFSGDAGATWEMLRFEVPFTAVSGNAGCFFWAHDAGGFHSPQRDPELYTRWIQFCTLSASLRLHSCGDHLDRRPWLWGEPFTAVMHAAFHLRAVLLPYVYTSAWQCHRDTLPLLRPLYLEYPRCEDAYRCPQEYLFGDHLLAAPVTSPGTGADYMAMQSVWIPEGSWVDWFTGEVTAGPRWLEIAAPLGRIPLWVRAGIPLPLQPYSPRMTTEPLARLVVRCTAPPADGDYAAILYEDDGQTDAYRHGTGAVTPLLQRRAGNRLTLRVGPAAGTYAGQPEARAVEFQLHGYGAIQAAEADGHPLAVEAQDGVAVLRLPPAAPTVARTVTLRLAGGGG